MPSSVLTAPTLTTDRIVEEALRAADRGGLEAVSLRRLAATFGVTPMALYHYVHDKDELLDRMAERVLDELELPRAEAPWQDGLRAMAESFLRVAAAHPAAPALLSRPFEAPSA